MDGLMGETSPEVLENIIKEMQVEIDNLFKGQPVNEGIRKVIEDVLKNMENKKDSQPGQQSGADNSMMTSDVGGIDMNDITKIID